MDKRRNEDRSAAKCQNNVAHIFGVNLNFFCPILDVKKRYLNILLWAKVSEKCNLGTRKMLIAKKQ